MTKRRQVLIDTAVLETEDAFRMSRVQRTAFLAGAAALALFPGLGIAHAAYSGLPGDLGWDHMGDHDGANVPVVADASDASLRSSASKKSPKSAKTPRGPAVRGGGQPAPVQAVPQQRQPAPIQAVPQAAPSNEPGGRGSIEVESPPPLRLTGAQAEAVAGHLGGGLSAADVEKMTMDELLAAAQARGLTGQDVAAAAGIPETVLQRSGLTPDVWVAGAGLLLTGGVALWRRIRPAA